MAKLGLSIYTPHQGRRQGGEQGANPSYECEISTKFFKIQINFEI